MPEMQPVRLVPFGETHLGDVADLILDPDVVKDGMRADVALWSRLPSDPER
jgi:hypothetical protein